MLIRYTILVCSLLVVLSACQSSIPSLSVQGELAGYQINTTVDSDIARYYLEHYLRGEYADPEMHRKIDDFHAQLQGGEINRDMFARIANSTSPDLATLMLASHLLSQESNARMQASVAEELGAMLGLQHRTSLGSTRYGSYVILFAPGWLYRFDPATGADFRQQRDILDRLGIQTVLIDTEESGTVERNAEIIAEEIVALTDKRREVAGAVEIADVRADRPGGVVDGNDDARRVAVGRAVVGLEGEAVAADVAGVRRVRQKLVAIIAAQHAVRRTRHQRERVRSRPVRIGITQHDA